MLSYIFNLVNENFSNIRETLKGKKKKKKKKMKTEKHHNQPTNDKLINHINKQSNNHTNNPLLHLILPVVWSVSSLPYMH